MRVVKLAVPYRSQWDRDASSHSADCGPTCLAMLLNAAGSEHTPDDIYDFLPPKEKKEFTSMGEMIAAARSNDLTLDYATHPDTNTAHRALLDALDAGQGIIPLVSYAPWQEHTGNPFKWGHFVVVTGYDANHILIHDPLFGLWQRRARGRYLRMETALFLEAWGGFDPLENPNFAWLSSDQQLELTVIEEQDSAERGAEIEPIEDTVERRIMALAAYIKAFPPDLTRVDERELWLTHLGDWGAETTTYVVKPNDTLAAIALAHYGESNRWKAIQAFNELATSSIWVGQRLAVPLHDAEASHENPALPHGEAVVFESAEITPETALDYDALGSQTIGIGFLEPLSAQPNG